MRTAVTRIAEKCRLQGTIRHKRAITALLAAVDAIKASGLLFRSNIKLVFDGEEEIGSPNLERIVAANRGCSPAMSG